MADTKISALTAASALGGTEVLPAVQSGADVGVTATQIQTFVESNLTIPTGANPTATAGTAAVNGSAATFMRSDGAPAIPQGSSSTFGLVKVDGTTITASSGVITSVASGLKMNATTSDPGVSNDNTQGYSAGSTWTNTSTGRNFFCTSASTGAAIWRGADSFDHPGYIANNWYPHQTMTPATGTAVVSGTARFVPFIPKENITIGALGVRIATVGTSNLQLAIYASDPSTRRPTGTVLSSTGNISNTVATNVNATLGANVSVLGGMLYWFAMNNNDSAMICTAPALSATNVGALLGSTTQSSIAGTANLSGVSTPLTFGTWSDVTSATWTEAVDSKHAMIIFKVASIP